MKIHNVEQRSPEWFDLRLGKATASEFDKVIKSNGSPSAQRHGYAIQLACELYAGDKLNLWGGSTDIQRGRFLEDEAVRLYEFQRDCRAEPIGFITDDAEQIGCSPDALIGDDGMVEVKCLKAEKHAAAILRWRRDRECPPDYVQQTQGQLLVTGRAWCDLILHHAALPMLVMRQTPDTKLQDALRTGLAELIAERDRVLAELISQRDGRDD